MSTPRKLGLIFAAAGVLVFGVLVWHLFLSVRSPFSTVRLSVVRKLSDQAVLANLAASSMNLDVRKAAVEKLWDQAALAKLATADDADAIDLIGQTLSLRDVRLAAVEKLTDQDALTQVAMLAPDPEVRKAASELLTDPIRLARVASSADPCPFTPAPLLGQLTCRAHDDSIEWSRKWPGGEYGATIGAREYFPARAAAVARLTSEGVSQAAMNASEPKQQAWLFAVGKFIVAGDGIPAERRNRILTELLPLAARYADPLWISRFGMLRNISLFWTRISATYAPDPINSIGQPVYGEFIRLTTEFEDRGKPRKFLASWKTAFPHEVSEHPSEIPAHIAVDQAYIPWLAGDQAALAQVATSDQDRQFRNAAIANLTDQSALANVAISEPNYDIRLSAVAKLTDQSTLAKLATSEQDYRIRMAAEGRLRELH